jgi:hypothetical protein
MICMHCRKPLWLMLFLILWLPLQGFAAPLMPFCQHAQNDAEAMPCHGDQGDDADTAPTADCDGCSLCHLCGSPAQLVFVGWHDIPRAGAALAVFSESFSSHIPAHPRRPPRSVLL